MKIDKKNSANYGYRSLDEIINYFNFELGIIPKLEKSTAAAEYNMFKTTLINSFNSSSTIQSILEYFFIRSDIYPIITLILEYFYVIILSSVECERSISRLNIIKTKLRNNLSETNLDNHMATSIIPGLLRVSNSEILDDAFRLWYNDKNRYFS